MQYDILSVIKTAESSDELVDKLITGITNALNVQGGRVTHLRAPKLPRFSGKTSVGDLTLSQWLEKVDIFCDQYEIPITQKAQVILNHLDGAARQEIRCHSVSSDDLDTLLSLLTRHFGSKDTTQTLKKRFHERVQKEGESLDEFSRALMCMYDAIIDVAPDREKEAHKGLRDSALIDKFVAGARSNSIRLELRRIRLANPDKTFLEIRDYASDLLESFDTKVEGTSNKRGLVYEVSVDDCPEGIASTSNMHTDSSLIRHLVQQEAALEKCVLQQQTIMERHQEQLSELLARKTQAAPKYTRQKRNRSCFYCGRPGHIQAQCWELQKQSQNRNYEYQNSGDLNAKPPL
nr:uncharacterized protein LOC129265254 [Lytechinus pictus]